MHPYEYQPGRSALIVSMPHVGSFVPEEIRARLSPTGRMVADTDWDLDRLYDFLPNGEVNLMRANLSRYVIDLGRAPDDRPLYAGMRHPGLVPTISFDDVPLYQLDLEPDAEEIALRRERYWRPYHDRLAAIIDDVRRQHGYAVLFDCHSIRSVVPRYMPGRIPDLNLGTADGASCAPGLREELAAVLSGGPDLTVAVDGVFKGGYITRHYGNPPHGVHAFQLEMSRAAYMREEPTPILDADKCNRLRPTLLEFVRAAGAWRPSA